MSRNLAPVHTRWDIDAAHTHVGFAVRHMMFATVRGGFAGVAGTLELNDRGELESVQVAIDTATIDTGTEQRDAHLRSPDFFDVAQHPEMTFRSRRVERTANGACRVWGDLTIRGVRREIVLEAEEQGRGIDPWGQERIGFAARTSIRRGEFGLKWNQVLEKGGVLVGDAVEVAIEGQAVLK